LLAKKRAKVSFSITIFLFSIEPTNRDFAGDIIYKAIIEAKIFIITLDVLFILSF